VLDDCATLRDLLQPSGVPGNRSLMENGSTLHDRPRSFVVERAGETLHMESEEIQVVSSGWSRCGVTLELRRSDLGPGTVVEESSIDHLHDSSDCSYRHDGIPRGGPCCPKEDGRKAERVCKTLNDTNRP
jgi:hypothetical protein